MNFFKKGNEHPAYVKQFVQTSAGRLAPFLVAGKLNSEYIQGNQYRYINPRRLQIEKMKDDPKIYLERKIFNRILSIYLTRIGILSNNMPIPGFKPQDSSTKRQFDAIRGNNFINNFIKEIELKKLYNKLIKHADINGLAWIKTGIDWNQGDPIFKNEMSTQDENTGDKSKGTNIINEGRPFIEIPPFHEVFVDNYTAESMNEIQELVHRRPLSLTRIQKKWGITAEAEKIDTMGVAALPKKASGFGISDIDEYAYVYEYYKSPTSSYPNGRYTITINDKIVYEGPLPYPNGKDRTRKIPFDFVALQNIPNYLVGTTIYSQIIPIQDTFNSIKNRYLEYVNHIAIGQLYVWEGSLVNKNQFSTKPGRMVPLKRNSRPPQPVQKDKLTVEFNTFLRGLEEDMLITAGLSQLTAYGLSKSNMRTDGVVDKIDESDQNKLVTAIENLSTSLIDAFKKILYSEQYRKEVLYKKLGLSKEDKYLSKYKLDSVDPEQLTIVNRDFLMQSDQVLEKKMQQATNLGLYNPEFKIPYKAKVNMLDAIKCNYLVDTIDPQEKATHDLIENEHYEILEKKSQVKAEEFHQHEQHLYEHTLFRISPELRQLKETDREEYTAVAQALEAHIEQHTAMAQQSQKPSAYANAKAAFNSTARRQPSQG